MTKNTKIKLALLIVMGVALVGYLATAIHYAGHFFPGTTVDGVDASDKTAKEVEESIIKKVSDYKLTIVEEDRENEEISASEAGLKIDIPENEVKNILKTQSGFAWPAGIFGKAKYNTDHGISVNDEMVDAKVATLDCITNKGSKSVNASYKFDGEKFVIIDEVYGTRLKKKTLSKAVKEAMTSLEEKLDLRERQIYIQPKIKKDNKKLVKVVNKLNKCLNTTITYEVGQEKEVIDKATQATFFSVSDDNKIVFNDQKILDYLHTMGKKYNTFSMAREFKTSYGMTVTVPSGGDYGWWINYAAELEQLKKDISGGKDVTRDFVYHNQAASHDKPDYGNSYVEVNIATQHLFLVIEGKVVLESDFVSGNVSRGNGTPLGTFRIAYKQKDATLNGENYSTPVKWWMPFYFNVGLHDASWRSNFGGQIYKTSGSHGCVNLPPAVAEKIYGYVEEGFPVIVYNEAPGASAESDSEE